MQAMLLMRFSAVTWNVDVYKRQAKGMHVIGLTGKSGVCMRELCDVAICVPETETYRIQELHLPVYHCLCLMIEEEFFG